MNLENSIDSISKVENAAGQYYLCFPYTSSIGKTIEQLTVQVPMKHMEPSANDKKALLEAMTVQGGLGRWILKDDGTVWLIPSNGASV